MPSSHGSSPGGGRAPEHGPPVTPPGERAATSVTDTGTPGAAHASGQGGEAPDQAGQGGRDPNAGGGAGHDGGNGQAAAHAERDAEMVRMEDRLKRALADLDNYRKRSAREIDRRVDEVRERLLREWLDVVDSVERALRMDTAGPLAEGLRAVLDQMESILQRQGVQRIGEAGERFDPERHEAIDVRMTDEVPDRTVLEVVRSGWALGDRVLRPAQVVVSRRQQPAV